MNTSTNTSSLVKDTIGFAVKWQPQPRKAEYPTSVHQFLRGKGKLDGTGARLAYEDRWMVFSGIANCWVVYQRKSNTQKTRVLYSGDLPGALDVLGQGRSKDSREGQCLLAPGLAGT